MIKSISQREARRFRKRVQELEQIIVNQRRTYATEWPGGERIAQVDLSAMPEVCGRLVTVRLLRHALVAIMRDDQKTVAFYALPQPQVPQSLP